MTTPEILRQAASYVRGGWTTGIRHDVDGKVCALGAIECAVYGRRIVTREWYQPDVPEAFDDAREACDALGAMIPGGMYEIAVWNNADDQTAENVAATMELAAICFEQAHAQAQTTNAVDPQVEVLERGLRA